MISKETKKVKIVYLVDFLRTIQAGTEKQLSHLLHYFPDAGFDVQLVSLQKSPFLLNDAPHIFPKVRFSTLDAKSDLSKSLSSFFRLFRLLQEEKPTLVHSFFPASNSLGIITARLAGIKKLISSRRDMGFNLNRMDISLLKIADRFVSCIIVNAGRVKEYTVQIEGIQSNRIKVIRNGISLDGYNTSYERSLSGKPVIGIVANLNRPVKRVDLFIKAAAIIHRSFPQTEFWVIGDGPLRTELEKLAFDLSLDSSMRFFGRQPDVHKYISQMSIGVITSDSEGLSNAIMEYMCAGLPVVATDVGGNPELVKHELTGLLVPPNDESLLAEAIVKLINTPENRVRMGMKGRDVIGEDFSIKNMLKETSRTYESLLNGANYQ
jgi:glycosyltransferase involved in cell wall biosynthesis